ncbi:MAG: hypothetical protein CMJ64_27980 [Planctomycetaceae bacterium]|nr:hypothetical protein [Planctomycetaceae bacterium]
MKSLLHNSVGACALYVSLGLCLGIILPLAEAIATESLTVVRIEEDWELVVGTPDANSTAPQVTCFISPTQDIDSLHAAFELNHHSQAEFTPGGLQLQLWDDEILMSATSPLTESVLSSNGETIRWTQAMELAAGGLTFEITGGSSTTWGNFGGDSSLRASFTTELTNLNGYSPTTSVQHSGIGYAANRVVTLSLKRVRVTLQDGAVLEDTTERVAHTTN